MKYYIILVLLLLLSIRLVAQDISVEFSIEWKDKLDFEVKEFKDEIIRPAFLNITYRNVSNTPLYCLKITEGKVGLPEILTLRYWDGYSGNNHILNVNDDYFKRKYFVGFESNPWYGMALSWDIRNDTSDIEYKIIKETWKPWKSDIATRDENGKLIFFNDELEDDSVVPNDWLLSTLNFIYNYIYCNYYPEEQSKIGKDGKEQTWHQSSDITQDTIMNHSIDKFVFLKPGETYVDKYNLIGFQITGGTFTFQLDDTKSLDYVETESVKKEDGTYESPNPTKPLPKKVGEYELFTGEFLTNKVSVQFPGIRLKNDR